MNYWKECIDNGNEDCIECSYGIEHEQSWNCFLLYCSAGGCPECIKVDRAKE